MNKYWDTRYMNGGNSGAGSYGKESERKVLLIRDLINASIPKIETILDIGCGDFNLGNQFMKYIDAQYTGVDISPTIVKRNKELYGNDNIAFHVAPYTGDKADVVICMDVLFHIIDEKEYEDFLKYLSTLYNRYLIVSVIGKHEVVKNWQPHVKPRSLPVHSSGDKCILGTLISKDEIVIDNEPTTKIIYFFSKE